MPVPRVQTDSDGEKVTFEIDPNDVQDFVYHCGAEMWASATAYQHEQYVRSPNGKFYQARESHTSGSAFTDDLAKWSEYKLGAYLDDENGELISSIEDVIIWDADGNDITGGGELSEATPAAPTADGKSVIFWLTNGTAGATYYVTTRIATDNTPVARKREFSFRVQVKDF